MYNVIDDILDKQIPNNVEMGDFNANATMLTDVTVINRVNIGSKGSF